MKVVLFGATGMVGQGVLRECLRDPAVTSVLSVVRSASGQQHAKLREIEHRNFEDFSALAAQFIGLDACFWCLGVASTGMSEAAYRRVTHDFTLAAAKVLVANSPRLTFVFVSGAGTDSTGKGRVMWARVKGHTENELAALPFAATYFFRPGYIQPMDGIHSRTKLYRVLYAAFAPLNPVLKRLFPQSITTTRNVGRAMINVVKKLPKERYLENPDINRVAAL